MTESILQPKEQTEQAAPECAHKGARFTPRVDIYETEKELFLFTDLPGVRSEDVNLQFDKGELVLHGRVQPRGEHGEFLSREYEVGDFYRVFRLHESIDGSRIEATCKNGVLTIHLPKVHAVVPKKVAVTGE